MKYNNGKKKRKKREINSLKITGGVQNSPTGERRLGLVPDAITSKEKKRKLVERWKNIFLSECQDLCGCELSCVILMHLAKCILIPNI